MLELVGEGVRTFRLAMHHLVEEHKQNLHEEHHDVSIVAHCGSQGRANRGSVYQDEPFLRRELERLLYTCNAQSF